MKYVRGFNRYMYTSDFEIESVVDEGDAGGRPYAVVDVTSVGASYSSDSAYYGTETRRVMRIRYTDIGANAYTRFFISDWKALYRDLAEMAGTGWREPRCMTSSERMWDGRPEDGDELYLEVRLGPAVADWKSIALEIAEAAAPLMLKMSVMGNEPVQITVNHVVANASKRRKDASAETTHW